ncbi:MAG TPA: hypothetical protein VF150_04445 [Thermoanaerobaculia bacterium]
MKALRPTTAFLLLAMAACGGGGGGSDSPTTPNPVQLLMMELLLENADGLPTLEQVTVTFDGIHQGTGGGTGPSVSSPPMHTNPAAAPGVHVLKVTVDDQTTSPNRYTLSGTARWGTRDIAIGPTTATLRTGESIEVEITL